MAMIIMLQLHWRLITVFDIFSSKDSKTIHRFPRSEACKIDFADAWQRAHFGHVKNSNLHHRTTVDFQIFQIFFVKWQVTRRSHAQSPKDKVLRCKIGDGRNGQGYGSWVPLRNWAPPHQGFQLVRTGGIRFKKCGWMSSQTWRSRFWKTTTYAHWKWGQLRWFAVKKFSEEAGCLFLDLHRRLPDSRLYKERCWFTWQRFGTKEDFLQLKTWHLR